ncbi:hypothetical protein [Geminocystis herdmanii]|uniref:hypothetical protein n=1 Tax=Geminocystis herdmanii TaxID=669359 RepID=UPI000694B028|nr:hypothetical protein [Geminocystis herdmanii]
MMDSFNDIFYEIYNQLIEELKKNNSFYWLLKRGVILWSQKIGLELNITICNLYDDIQQASCEIWQEWKPKKIENTQREFIKSNLYKIVSKLINKSPLRSIKMNNPDIIFIVFLSLNITAFGLVIYKITESVSSSNNDGYFLNLSSTPISQKLILIVNALKKDCLDKIKNQDNRILPEDTEKLYRATSFLWMGIESELNEQFKNYSDYIAETDQESEYDIYIVEINLPEVKEGLKKDVDKLSRIDAFRELSDLPDLEIKISPRLKVSVYENTNVYVR